MGLFNSRPFSWLQPLRAALTPAPAAVSGKRIDRRAIAGGRLSLDKANGDYFGSFAVVAPAESEQDWRSLNLDSETLDTLSPAKLLELMVDLSPEVSNGLWNFIRLCNPGYEVYCEKPGSEVEDTQAQAAVDAFINQLSDYYGSFDVVINRMFIGVFLRGAFLAELVLDRNGRMPVDFATPDPLSVRFERVKDDVRGTVWRLGQYQYSGWVALDRPTIRYVPLDPLPGSPYGRPLVSPALHTSLFLLGLLHDLRRVVSQQGYPRLDLSIDFEALAAISPPDAQPGTAEFDSWVTDVMNEIRSVYHGLQPDDAYVHSSLIKVNRPVGTVSGDMLGGIDALITALERMAARGMKMMPLLMGISDGATEQNSNRQWEIQIAGIKSLQHLAETMLGRLFGLALEAQGIASTVKFRFAEVRAAELLRDAQVEAMQIANEKSKYESGWISQDEASEAITGHAADAPEPRVQRVSGGPDVIQDNGDSEEADSDATNQQNFIRSLTGGRSPDDLPEPVQDLAELLLEIRAARAAVELRMVDAPVHSNGYAKEAVR